MGRVNPDGSQGACTACHARHQFSFRGALAAGAGLDEARSVALTTIVFFQLLQLVNARSLTRSAFAVAPFSNPFLLASMGAALLLQLAVLYVPALEWVLGTVPLAPAALGRAALTAVTVFAAVEIDKLFARAGARPQRSAPDPTSSMTAPSGS